jgi:hypothetical protein
LITICDADGSILRSVPLRLPPTVGRRVIHGDASTRVLDPPSGYKVAHESRGYVLICLFFSSNSSLVYATFSTQL